MSHLVRVFCRECNGESADPTNERCGWCMCQGHEDVNRTPDGYVPTHFEDGRPVREWVDRLFPEYHTTARSHDAEANPKDR